MNARRGNDQAGKGKRKRKGPRDRAGDRDGAGPLASVSTENNPTRSHTAGKEKSPGRYPDLIPAGGARGKTGKQRPVAWKDFLRVVHPWKKNERLEFLETRLIRAPRNVESLGKLPPVVEYHTDPGDLLARLPALCKTAKDDALEVFLGCASRRRKRGRKDDLARAFVLWADIDFKDTPEVEARRLLGDGCDFAGIPPSMVVHTGNGLHAYWRLLEAFDLDTPERIKEFEDLLERVRHFVRGDDVDNADRIMRIAGTANRKDPAGVVYADIETFELARAYTLDAFQTLPDPGKALTKAEPRSTSTTAAPPTGTVGRDGKREPELFSKACSFWARGDDLDEIDVQLQALNRLWFRHHPEGPHSPERVSEIAKRVLDYKQGERPAEEDPLPPIVNLADFMAVRIPRPPEVIEGVLHRGSKLIFGGHSKAFKTWVLANMAVDVATGAEWLSSFQTSEGRVLYINLELQDFAVQDRFEAIAYARKHEYSRNIDIWNLRGKARPLSLLLPDLLRQIEGEGYSLIIPDPIYKTLAGRNENDAGDIGQVCAEIEAVAVETGAAVTYGAHYAKGNAAGKDHIDRVSGSGVWARDPDAIVTATALVEPDAFAVEMTLRNFPQQSPFAIRWNYPEMVRAPDLDPAKLKKPGGSAPVYTIEDIIEHLEEGDTTTKWMGKCRDEAGISKTTFYRLLKTLGKNVGPTKKGKVWVKDA